MATNNRPLKAYVRFDGSGRVVAGSLILRKQKPKVGKWYEIPAYECCNDITSTTSTTSTTTTSAPVYSFSVRRWNTGPCESRPFATIYSNSPVLGEGVNVYNDSGLTSPILFGAYICDCDNNFYYRAFEGILSAPNPSICITTTTTTTSPV